MRRCTHGVPATIQRWPPAVREGSGEDFARTSSKETSGGWGPRKTEMTAAAFRRKCPNQCEFGARHVKAADGVTQTRLDSPGIPAFIQSFQVPLQGELRREGARLMPLGKGMLRRSWFWTSPQWATLIFPGIISARTVMISCAHFPRSWKKSGGVTQALGREKVRA